MLLAALAAFGGIGLLAALLGVLRRLAAVEQSQGQIGQNIHAVQTRLVETDTVAKGLAEATSAIHSDLSRAREVLVALQAAARSRQDLEYRTAESVRRLEAVIAGTQTKGAAGENIIEVVFAQLPADWQVRDLRVGNKTVEFGLRLPNNLVLPIDVKWAATDLVERFLAAEEVDEQQRLKSAIERVVLSKVREAAKYVDPHLTTDFGVAAVPDAVYDLCSGVQVKAFEMNVVLVSYSMFVPYLLLVFQMVLKTSRNVDVQRLNSYLQSARSHMDALQGELEGRLSRAITMLSNGRDDMRAHLSALSGGLTRLQIDADALDHAMAELEEEACPEIQQPMSNRS